MKVCQLCSVDFTVQKFLLPLIDGMQAVGWKVTTVCSDGPYVASLRAAGYQIQTVKINRRMFALSHFQSVWQLVCLLKRERFDLLHVHTPVASMLGRLAARIAGVPLVIYTAHGFYFHDEMPTWKYRTLVFLERLAGCWTDFLFTQSTEDATNAVRLGIMPLDKVLAIGNGVSVDRFNPQLHSGRVVREALGIPLHARVIGIVGRLVREKGYGEFLQAAEQLQSQFPDVYYLIVGERLASDYDAAIDANLAAAKVVLGDHLILAGMREDMPEVMAAMDVFCLPSYREGMPRTIIEAMIMAKPVVATNIRGSREEVIPQETGLLVPTRDVNALTAAFTCLLQDESLRVRQGQAGRARALALYDEQHVVQLQIDKIRKLLGLVCVPFVAEPETPLQYPGKVMVTGANGFVGQALCAHLSSQNIAVLASLRAADSTIKEMPGLTFAKPFPLRETTDWSGILPGIECVVHLAGIAHRLNPGREMLGQYFETNYAGTCHLARQAAAAGVRRFIYVSTIKVNGERSLNQPFTSEDTPNPQDAYAQSKWKAEQALYQISRETGMEVVILRPSLIYGPRVGANFLRMLNWVADGKPLPLAAVRNRRSLLYLGNFTDAVMHCMAHPGAANRTFLISDAESVSSADLVRRMATALGVRPHLLSFPLSTLRVMGKLFGRTYEIGRLTDSLEIDARDIQKSLHWCPPYSLDQGLAETARWFKETRS